MADLDKRINAMINETDPERKENLFNELRECYDQDFIPALFDYIKKHPKEVYFKIQSLIGENIDDGSIPFLIRMLKDKNDKIREISAECLGILRAKNACTDLVNLIPDKNNNVRYEAVMSVGRLKCRRGANAILARLEMDKESDQFVFVEMVIALGHLNTKNAKR
jgi:HEAT repeat protein